MSLRSEVAILLDRMGSHDVCVAVGALRDAIFWIETSGLWRSLDRRGRSIPPEEARSDVRSADVDRIFSDYREYERSGIFTAGYLEIVLEHAEIRALAERATGLLTSNKRVSTSASAMLARTDYLPALPVLSTVAQGPDPDTATSAITAMGLIVLGALWNEELGEDDLQLDEQLAIVDALHVLRTLASLAPPDVGTPA